MLCSKSILSTTFFSSSITVIEFCRCSNVSHTLAVGITGRGPAHVQNHATFLSNKETWLRWTDAHLPTPRMLITPITLVWYWGFTVVNRWLRTCTPGIIFSSVVASTLNFESSVSNFSLFKNYLPSVAIRRFPFCPFCKTMSNMYEPPLHVFLICVPWGILLLTLLLKRPTGIAFA